MKVNVNNESKKIVSWAARSSSHALIADDQHFPVVNGEGSVARRKPSQELPSLPLAPISTKPWCVAATKAELEGTEENFAHLRAYLDAVASGDAIHPSGKQTSWKGRLGVIPVSAVHGKGIEKFAEWVTGLLDSS